MRGFVEVLRPFQVRGWLFDQTDPEARLRVQVRVNGQPVGSAIANLFRQDLADAGVGDGHYAFVVNVTGTLPLDTPEAITVETVEADGTVQPVPILATVAIEKVHVQTTERLQESTVRGFFAVHSDEITGWAFDSTRPNVHLNVVVESDGRQLGQTLANVFQPHLVQANIGTGDHGFVLKAPPAEAPLVQGKVTAFAFDADGKKIALGVAVHQPAAKANDSPAPPAQNVVRFPADVIDSKHYPVIVLGAARSGTSAMAQALTTSGSYEGFEEGHFLDLLQPMLRSVADFYAARAEEWSPERSTLIGNVPQRFIVDGVQHIFIQAARHAFPSGRWVDKTPRPSMINVAPSLREIWPNARFIFMRRRAIENLESRLRKFPNTDFETHCREWALVIQNWYAIADQLKGAALEVDQLYLARNPTAVTSTLRDFLRLSDESANRIAQALANDQPERTESHFGAIADIKNLGWSSQQVEIFRSVCGEAMRLAGYSEGSDYYLSPEMPREMVKW
jgi:Sulfotransferase family